MAKPRYHEPPTAIKPVEGVRRKQLDERSDLYIGTAEGLVQSGVVLLEQLPGQPGMPTGSVRFRPPGEHWTSPGAIEIHRKLDGKFHVIVRVDAEERKRREEEGVARELRIATEGSGLEVCRYGQKLLNAYGSSAQLIAAGLLPPDFEFPSLGQDKWPSKDWAVGRVHYSVSNRCVSQAAKNRDERYDHWWFQVNDRDKKYPDDFVTICKAELAAAQQRRHQDGSAR